MSNKVHTIVGSLCIILLIAGATLAVTRPAPAASPPQYTVRQVQALVARQPGRWIGRVVLVQGELGNYPCVVMQCRGHALQFFILPPKVVRMLTGGPAALAQRQFLAAHPLLLVASPPNPVRSFIQSLPLGRSLDGASWQSPFRVRLLGSCTNPPCAGGLLLDPPQVGR